MTPFHLSLLATVPGMFSETIDAMVRQGMNNPSDIVDAELTAADIREALGCPIVLAGLIRKAAHAARAADAADAGETAALLTLLGGLTSPNAATRRAAVEGLTSKGVSKIVPDIRGAGVDLPETVGLVRSPQRALAEREGLWNSRGLVDVAVFMPPEPETLRSPFGAELVDQGDPPVATDSMTGIAWGLLRMSSAPVGKATLGLCTWAVSKNIHAGQSERVVFDDFMCGGPICQRATVLANQLKVQRETLEDLPVVKKPARDREPSGETTTTVTASNARRALYDLLVDKFNGAELRRLAGFVGPGIDEGMPGDSATKMSLASELIDNCRRHGLTRVLLQLVRRERPKVAATVDALLVFLT